MNERMYLSVYPCIYPGSFWSPGANYQFIRLTKSESTMLNDIKRYNQLENRECRLATGQVPHFFNKFPEIKERKEENYRLK